MVPALLQKNVPWSLKLSRHLVSIARLEVMGIPAMSHESDKGQAPPAPWLSVMCQLTETELSSISGNAIGLVAIGCAELYLLACTELKARQ